MNEKPVDEKPKPGILKKNLDVKKGKEDAVKSKSNVEKKLDVKRGKQDTVKSKSDVEMLNQIL